MRILPILSALALLSPACTLAEKPGAEAVWREMNLARQQPREYARIVEAAQPRDSAAAREAVRFLERSRPLPPLAWSAALSAGAGAHVTSQGPSGKTGHQGANGSRPWDRISRFGKWGGSVGENIFYGASGARAIVVALIVDAGVPNRGHRKNIFSRSFGVVGVAQGPHARFGSVCVMDFAGTFRPHEGTAPADGVRVMGRLAGPSAR